MKNKEQKIQFRDAGIALLLEEVGDTHTVVHFIVFTKLYTDHLNLYRYFTNFLKEKELSDTAHQLYIKCQTKGQFFPPFQQSKRLIHHFFMQPQSETTIQ